MLPVYEARQCKFCIEFLAALERQLPYRRSTYSFRVFVRDKYTNKNNMIYEWWRAQTNSLSRGARDGAPIGHHESLKNVRCPKKSVSLLEYENTA